MRFLQLNRISVHTPVSRFRCPETPHAQGRMLYSLNDIKKVFFNQAEKTLVIDYIGDMRPVTLCNISEKVYNRIVDELVSPPPAANTRVLTLGADGEFVDDAAYTFTRFSLSIQPNLSENPQSHLGPIPNRCPP